MNEDVGRNFWVDNEPKTFFLVKPLNCAFSHRIDRTSQLPRSGLLPNSRNFVRLTAWLEKAASIGNSREKRQVECNTIISSRIHLAFFFMSRFVFAMSDPCQVAILMGSKSDWSTMRHASDLLREFGIESQSKIVSAHRTPDLLVEFAKRAADQGLRIIIAGAGGAAHLPGMVAAHTHLPVLGVPIESRVLRGVDSLLSIVQMPAGIPVLTLAIGEAGAKNAALAAVSILALENIKLREKLIEFRRKQTEQVLNATLE
jgi:5-(carboxyamino)imidazole ribonucleotide mutase